MKGAAKKVRWQHARVTGRLPPKLMRCPGCAQFIYPQTSRCPHCGGELKVLRKKALRSLEKAQRALVRLQKLLDS